MAILSFEWTAQNALLLGLGYVVLVRLLRYRGRDGLQKKYGYHTRDSLKNMTVDDAHAIGKYLMSQEFPFTFLKSMQFALFRTYGIPSISKLLMKTRQFSTKQYSGKRYSDTEVLISEFVSNEPSSDRAIAATARLNYIHGIYQKQGLISNDDMLYTISLFALEPVRWIRRYEWRPYTEMETCAMGCFWKSQGSAMNIDFTPLKAFSTDFGSYEDDGLAFWHSLDGWSLDYERRVMVPDQNNKMTADQTVKILLWDIPQWMHPLGRMAVSALMDERLRTAMIYDAPPAWLDATVQVALTIRKYVVLTLLPPRPWVLRVRSIEEKPNKYGRYNLIDYAAEPWYIKNNFTNSWLDPKAWMKSARGLPVPGKNYKSEGYLIHEVGPRIAEGKGQKEQAENEAKIRAMNRGGCPFA